uniref:Reverse transcriptase domain-containing protein n=1 Tax=Anolis carolinensis TaxID=28377 RepID=A0A803TJC4_ANOCA
MTFPAAGGRRQSPGKIRTQHPPFPRSGGAMQPGKSSLTQWQRIRIKEIQEAATFKGFEKALQKVTRELSADDKASPRKPRRRRKVSITADKKARQFQHMYRTSKPKALLTIQKKLSPHCKIPLEELERHFTRVFAARDAEATPRRPDGMPPLPKIGSPKALERLRRDFTPKEVAEKLLKVPNKVNGKDKISREKLKQRDPGCHVLTAVFNRCKQFRRIPAAWKEVPVILNFKSGEPSDPANWRPLFLCDTLYKTYARCLARRVTDWAVAGGAVSPQQTAYVPLRKGTDEQHFLLQSTIDVARHKRQELALAKLDLCNAFGSIPHRHVFDMLSRFGVPEDFLDVLRSPYVGLSIVVMAANGKTQPIPMKRGLMQGCPLSPIVFNLSIEPLIRYIVEGPEGFVLYDQKVSVLAHADDIVFIASDGRGLQRMLDKASETADWIGLNFNAKKCESLHIRQSKLCSSRFTLQGKSIGSIERDQAFEYLGMPLILPNQPLTILKEPFRKLLGEAQRINVSPLTPQQKMDALKTSVLRKCSYLLKKLPVVWKELKTADYTITNMMMKWLGISEEDEIRLWIPWKDGGYGLLPLTDMANVATISYGFQLLNCLDDTVRNVARGALRSTVQRKLGWHPRKEELAYYLNGEFGRDRGDFTNLWCRVKTATWHSSQLISCTWTYHQGSFCMDVDDTLFSEEGRSLENSLNKALLRPTLLASLF